MLAFRSGSSARGCWEPPANGLDDEAERATLLALLLGLSTFIVRGAGRRYDELDLPSEGVADDDERQEVPHTPELDLEKGVEEEWSLPVADLLSSGA